MPRKTFASLAWFVVAGLVVFVVGYFSGPVINETTPAIAAENAVTFPPLDKLVHYTTVRRGVTREHMLTNPEALAAIKAGQPVAVGTHVVLVDFQSDVLHRYLVAQKMGEGSADWAYQWFWPDKSIKADENVAQCYSCHRSREDRQFMFTFTDALSLK
ncbi:MULTISPECIES: cytochrome P460 family protein [Rhizobium]|uniref:Cytochrome P460 domain-containing protein n=1 Tax=Rhizobium favelukesii TaxID=348824 RepID=W6RQW3_9HYPH|nr:MULTISPECIES: cytochrome P460 family protein [Rhizobium]MCS0461892.1 hypothetical protein [Rhizobium favelukesii]UFS79501.1 hypothetical protein LPB79_08065 [Rhizobium sp. T136]CDM63104.1 hypothetical protein LPU83_pLPU83d_1734 [Rhizobium favelukesii]